MDEFEKAYQGLNEAQRAAVDYIDGPLLVIAGPGTGKTQLLSVRVANILKQTDALPDNILCLTFTEAAADNMRSRLASFIGPDAYKVHIHTYHSLGALLLQENRPELNVAVDDLDRYQIIRDIQEHLHATDILRNKSHAKDIMSTISKIKQANLTPDDLRHIIKRNKTDNGLMLSAIQEHVTETKASRYPKCIPAYQNILAALQTFAEQAPQTIVGRATPLARLYYSSLAEILLRYEESEKVSDDLRKWRDKYFRKDMHDQFVFADEVANKKLESLANIMEQYTKHLIEHGQYDFDDMILQIIDILEHDDEKRYNAQERFQYILLDEFQDTNDAQARLVAVLTDNPNIEKPNVMAVGDDDQAIYGFQGASSSIFYDFDEHYHPKHILLNKNYRSSKPILDLAHNIIEQCEDRFCAAPNVNIDKNISAENPPKSTSIETHQFTHAPAEYDYVAQQIRTLIEGGTPKNKIAIIAPYHKYLLSILPYLHQYNIPIAYQKRDNVLDIPEIYQILNFINLLLALAQNPAKADPYWFELLSHEAWGLKPVEILNMVEEARKNRRSIMAEISNSDNDQLQSVAEYCAAMATKVNTRSAEYFLSTLCAKLYPNSEDINLYSALNILRELAHSKNQGSEKLYLADFCRLLQAYYEAEMAIYDKSPIHESTDAVQIITAHGSKGLEYDHVFIIAADDDQWSQAKGNTDKLTLPRNLEYVRHTGDSGDEKIRLFFVAVTRARAHLYLTYSTTDFLGHSTDSLRYLDIRTDSKGDSYYSNVIPKPYQTIPCHDTTDEDSLKIIAPKNWLDDYLPNSDTIQAMLYPRVANYRLSPTHLNTFIDVKHGGPREFLRRYILHAPGEESPALFYGTLVHETMQFLNDNNASNEGALAHYLEQLDGLDMDENDRKTLRQRGETELTYFLKQRGDNLRQTEAICEYAFPGENLVINEVPVTGKIDRIEIDEKSKTITVADFKTSKAREKFSSGDNTFLYKIQLYFYKAMIEHSRKFQGYKVTRGRIDYIAANDYGELHPLWLNFNDKEYAKIKQLMQIVYRHVTSLNLPDFEGYTQIKFVNTLRQGDFLTKDDGGAK